GASSRTSGLVEVTSSSAPQSGQGTISPRSGLSRGISASHSGQVAVILVICTPYLWSSKPFDNKKPFQFDQTGRASSRCWRSRRQANLPESGVFFAAFFGELKVGHCHHGG